MWYTVSMPSTERRRDPASRSPVTISAPFSLRFPQASGSRTSARDGWDAFMAAAVAELSDAARDALMLGHERFSRGDLASLKTMEGMQSMAVALGVLAARRSYEGHDASGELEFDSEDHMLAAMIIALGALVAAAVSKET